MQEQRPKDQRIPQKITIQIKATPENQQRLNNQSCKEVLITGGDLEESSSEQQPIRLEGSHEDDLIKSDEICHQRQHSEYSNNSKGLTQLQSNKSSGIVQKNLLEKLESGLNYLNKEQGEEALKEFKICEQIYQKFPTEVDDNYLSVLKYNQACCYQRIGQIDNCISSLQDAIESVEKKIKLILDKKNQSFVERSIVSPSTMTPSQGNANDGLDRNNTLFGVNEVILGNLLHKYRYQCKFHLQVCAVLSQLNKHEEAYSYGEKAANFASQLMENSAELCNFFIHEISKRREQLQPNNKSCFNQQRGSISIHSALDFNAIGGGNASELLGDESNLNNMIITPLNQMSPYGGGLTITSKNKLHQSHSQSRLHQKTTVEFNTFDQKLMQTYAESQCPPTPQMNNYFTKERNSTSSNCSIKVNIRRASSADGSLERIHTFNLKLLKLQNQKGGANTTTAGQNKNNNQAAADTFIDGGTGSQNANKILQLIKTNADINKSVGGIKNTRNNAEQHLKSTQSAQSSQTSTNKAYYVEEKIKILESTLFKIQPVINEFQRIIQEFKLINTLSDKEREKFFKGKKDKYKKQMKISFHEETEINLLKFNHKFKLNVRNMLGIKHQDDWIFNLNIGNVMHLSPMNTDELSAKLDKTHELNKDAMLEKIILFVVAFFCVGTELRFLSQKENATLTKKDSEMWHAKSLHVACIFLPEDCPLVNHIINSYKKHHLNPKIEMMKAKKLEQETLQQRLMNCTKESRNIETGSALNSKESSTAFNSEKNFKDKDDAVKQIKIKIEKYLKNHHDQHIIASKQSQLIKPSKQIQQQQLGQTQKLFKKDNSQLELIPPPHPSSNTSQQQQEQLFNQWMNRKNNFPHNNIAGSYSTKNLSTNNSNNTSKKKIMPFPKQAQQEKPQSPKEGFQNFITSNQQKFKLQSSSSQRNLNSCQSQQPIKKIEETQKIHQTFIKNLQDVVIKKDMTQQNQQQKQQSQMQGINTDQIMLHYKVNSRNTDDSNGIVKYKSFENFPIKDILNEINKQQKTTNNQNKNIEMKIQNNMRVINTSNERPQSGGNKKGNLLKKDTNNEIKLLANNIQKSQTRIGSPSFNDFRQQKVTNFGSHLTQQMVLLRQQQEFKELQLQQHQQQQQQAMMMSYNFNNVNFINNVNIFGSDKDDIKKIQNNNNKLKAPKKANINSQYSLISKSKY